MIAESRPRSGKDQGGERRERRQVPRVLITMPVRLIARNGRPCHGSSINLSRFGLKLGARTQAEPGDIAWLWLHLPDGQQPIRTLALLVRHDSDGDAFFFGVTETTEMIRLETVLKRHESRDSSRSAT